MSDLSYLFECEVFFVVVYISMLNVGCDCPLFSGHHGQKQKRKKLIIYHSLYIYI